MECIKYHEQIESLIFVSTLTFEDAINILRAVTNNTSLSSIALPIAWPCPAEHAKLLEEVLETNMNLTRFDYLFKSIDPDHEMIENDLEIWGIIIERVIYRNQFIKAQRRFRSVKLATDTVVGMKRKDKDWKRNSPITKRNFRSSGDKLK